jgi:hypothetical protein
MEPVADYPPPLSTFRSVFHLLLASLVGVNHRRPLLFLLDPSLRRKIHHIDKCAIYLVDELFLGCHYNRPYRVSTGVVSAQCGGKIITAYLKHDVMHAGQKDSCNNVF